MTPVQGGATIVAMLSAYKEALDAGSEVTDSGVGEMILALDEEEARLCLGVLLGLTVSLVELLTLMTGAENALISLSDEMMAVLMEEAAEDG